MKFLVPLMLIFIFGCSKGTQGSKENVTSGKVSSLSEELKKIKVQTNKSSHSISQEELNKLLAEGLITSKEHTKLVQLAQ